jgi:LysM repeat protein
MKSIPATILPALLIAIISGCDLSGRVPVDQSLSMKSARAAELLGNFDEALEKYEDVIAEYPRSALPHLQMAILLHEKKKDYIGAIYHYGRYVKLADTKAERASVDIVSGRMAKANQLLTAQCAKAISAGSANRDVSLMSSIDDLNRKVSALEANAAKLAESNETLRTTIVGLNNRITRQSLLIDKMKNTSEGGASRSTAGLIQYQSISNEDGTTTSVQTYEVKSGDTLSRISEIAYGDASKWPRIKKANPDKIKDDRVKPGDVLIIP